MLIDAIKRLLPHRPATPPAGHYVYGIRVGGHLRYVGKGSAYRAWDHFDMIIATLAAALEGRDHPDALMFHRLTVRTLAMESLDDVNITVDIYKDAMTEAQAYAEEERLINGHPLFIEATGDSSGLWNCGGRGRAIHARQSTAEAAYLNGDWTPAVKRRRPTKAHRDSMRYLHGNGFGANRRVIAPTALSGGADGSPSEGN